MTVFRTNSRAAIVVVALIGLFLLENPALEAHTFTANSSVSIRFRDGKFRGRVRSSRPSCVRKRLVKVYKARPNRPDVFIGDDRTNSNGRYAIPKPPGVKGKFYSRVKRRITGKYKHNHKCRRAISRIIKAP